MYKNMWWGIVIIVLGVVFLLKNLGVISGVSWGIIWPAMVIVFGLALISRKLSRKSQNQGSDFISGPLL